MAGAGSATRRRVEVADDAENSPSPGGKGRVASFRDMRAGDGCSSNDLSRDCASAACRQDTAVKQLVSLTIPALQLPKRGRQLPPQDASDGAHSLVSMPTFFRRWPPLRLCLHKYVCNNKCTELLSATACMVDKMPLLPRHKHLGQM